MTPLSIFFVNFANKIYHMHCTWVYNNEFFYYKVVICNVCRIWQILLAKLTKNILRGINFTNLKTPSGYIAKSKPQGVCLQLREIPGDDYAIWPSFFFFFFLSHLFVVLLFFILKSHPKGNLEGFFFFFLLTR